MKTPSSVTTARRLLLNETCTLKKLGSGRSQLGERELYTNAFTQDAQRNAKSDGT